MKDVFVNFFAKIVKFTASHIPLAEKDFEGGIGTRQTEIPPDFRKQSNVALFYEVPAETWEIAYTTLALRIVLLISCIIMQDI